MYPKVIDMSKLTYLSKYAQAQEMEFLCNPALQFKSIWPKLSHLKVAMHCHRVPPPTFYST